jgi:hypothetical protein
MVIFPTSYGVKYPLPPPRLELFRRALKPLVRTCLRGQHTLQEVIDVLKLVFVEVGVLGANAIYQED